MLENDNPLEHRKTSEDVRSDEIGTGRGNIDNIFRNIELKLPRLLTRSGYGADAVL